MENDQTEESLDLTDFIDPSPNPTTDSDLAALCDVLKEHGVTRVVIHYEGSGDSGSIAGVEYLPKGVPVPKSVDDKLYDVAEEYCPDGYENNDGGYGDLTIFPFDGVAKLEHSDCFEDSVAMDTSPADLPDVLRLRLAGLGVTEITGRFDGSGDSGQIEELTVAPEAITLDPALADEVDDFLLDRLAGGWENNSGGFGDFAIDVATGEVEVNAYWRVEDSNSQTTSWNWRQPCPTHTITR